MRYVLPLFLIVLLPGCLSAQAPTPVASGVSAWSLGSSPMSFQGSSYFVGEDSSGNVDIWRSDGTATGTVRITNTGQSTPIIYILGAVGSLMYYVAPHTASSSYAVYAYNPTTTSSEAIHLVAGPSMQISVPVGIGSTAYFSAWGSGSTDFDFVTTNGTAAGTSVTMTQPIAGYNVLHAGSFNGQLVIGLPGANGVEPHIGDWTTAGMTEIADINSSGDSEPDVLGEINGVCVFAAYDPAFGVSLYRTDGTSGGTSRISNGVYANTVFLAPYIRAGNLYYFHYNTGSNTQLWRTDGTTAGTFQLTNFTGTTNAHLSIHPSGSYVYFDVTTATGLQLWRTNGTIAGTTLVTALTGTSTVSMATVGGTLYLLRTDLSNNSGLWTSDGTAGGTTFLTDAGLPNAEWRLLGEVGTSLLFSTNTGTVRQLWTIAASPSTTPPPGGGSAGASGGGGGGGCTSTSGSVLPFGFALLAIVLVRRRRRAT